MRHHLLAAALAATLVSGAAQAKDAKLEAGAPAGKEAA